MRTFVVLVALGAIILAGGCRTTISDPELGSLDPEKEGYFAAAGGRLLFEKLEGGGIELRYSIWLQPRGTIKRPLKLSVTFENPEDKGKPLKVTQDVAVGETAIEITSPPVWGVRPNHEYAVVIGIRDLTGKLLGTQRIAVQSLIDTRGLQH